MSSTMKRTVVRITVAAAVVSAVVIAITRNPPWYRPGISFDCLQFGNINGDKHVDLMTQDRMDAFTFSTTIGLFEEQHV